mmetsp:Transcript_21877/g.41787  ORF Transcript_21877/g.41787 Transcript_21877/m.41787 type:complete len:205 (+) Transcript_21877:431-1045(+)
MVASSRSWKCSTRATGGATLPLSSRAEQNRSSASRHLAPPHAAWRSVSSRPNVWASLTTRRTSKSTSPTTACMKSSEATARASRTSILDLGNVTENTRRGAWWEHARSRDSSSRCAAGLVLAVWVCGRPPSGPGADKARLFATKSAGDGSSGNKVMSCFRSSGYFSPEPKRSARLGTVLAGWINSKGGSSVTFAFFALDDIVVC